MVRITYERNRQENNLIYEALLLILWPKLSLPTPSLEENSLNLPNIVFKEIYFVSYAYAILTKVYIFLKDPAT